MDDRAPHRSTWPALGILLLKGEGANPLRALLAVVVAVVIVVGALAFQLLRAVPPPVVQSVVGTSFTVPGTASPLPWPSRGQAAVAVSGVGLMGTSGVQKAHPIASLAKIMTALLVLKARPLAAGATGPTVTVTPADVARYQSELKGGQSVVRVVAGEKLTERQLLLGLLLPSGNNLAGILADWVAGSQTAFVARMNAEAKALGLTHTHYVDASGVNPGTVSSAVDQVHLALKAMAIPTFRHIVALPQATLPVAGVVYNVNYFLGHSGIIGVKTGTTTPAGGCYVFAARPTVSGKTTLIVGAVLGQGGVQPLLAALQAGQKLIQAAQTRLTTVKAQASGATVARLHVAWTTGQSLKAPSSVSFLGWPGLTGSRRVILPSRALKAPLATGAPVGSLVVSLGSQSVTMPLKLPSAVPAPRLRWRLARIP